MTSPGHVFFAFDTGEPSSNAWQYSSDVCETVIHNRTVWIPVEATILKEGFFTAWEEASKLVARYSALEELEFLPVREAWATYPALPLPESAFTIAEPAPERVGRALDATFGAVKDSLYKKVVAALTANLERAGGRSRARLMNKLGILHARFGEDNEAEEVFREALDTAPSSVSAYVNLANLKLLQNKPKEALSLLEQGKRLRPESVVINLLLAKTYHQTGDSAKARTHYRLVEKQSPEAAKSIAYIQGESGGGSARASEAAKQEPFYWDVEE
jgi:tetratricopeptide (TPR) repeat protein